MCFFRKKRKDRRIKKRHILGVMLGIFGFLLVVTLASCASMSRLNLNQPPVQYYLAAEVGNDAEKEVTEAAIYQLEEITTSKDYVRVDYFVGASLQNVYANTSDKQGLWGLASNLPTMENEDTAIRSAIYTLSAIAEKNPDSKVQAIIVTAGTADKAAIDAIFEATNTLIDATNFHIAVVGVSGENRAPLSNGFSQIADRVQFAGTREEITSIFRGFGG